VHEPVAQSIRPGVAVGEEVQGEVEDLGVPPVVLDPGLKVPSQSLLFLAEGPAGLLEP